MAKVRACDGWLPSGAVSRRMGPYNELQEHRSVEVLSRQIARVLLAAALGDEEAKEELDQKVLLTWMTEQEGDEEPEPHSIKVGGQETTDNGTDSSKNIEEQEHEPEMELEEDLFEQEEDIWIKEETKSPAERRGASMTEPSCEEIGTLDSSFLCSLSSSCLTSSNESSVTTALASDGATKKCPGSSATMNTGKEKSTALPHKEQIRMTHRQSKRFPEQAKATSRHLFASPLTEISSVLEQQVNRSQLRSPKKRKIHGCCAILECNKEAKVGGSLCMAHQKEQETQARANSTKKEVWPSSIAGQCPVKGCAEVSTTAGAQGLCRRHQSTSRSYCSVWGCGKRNQRMGLCKGHGAPPRLCVIIGCPKKAHTGQMCWLHYVEANEIPRKEASAAAKNALPSATTIKDNEEEGGPCHESSPAPPSANSHRTSMSSTISEPADGLLVCLMQSCRKKATAQGLCDAHYTETMRCSASGCMKPSTSQGLCIDHNASTRLKFCTATGCKIPAKGGRGLCRDHIAALAADITKLRWCSKAGCDRRLAGEDHQGPYCLRHWAEGAMEFLIIASSGQNAMEEEEQPHISANISLGEESNK